MSYQTKTKKILFKRKKHIKKLMNEISKRACSYILKDKRLKLKHLPSLNFVVNMQEKKKNKEILLATHQHLLKISRLCQDRQNI